MLKIKQMANYRIIYMPAFEGNHLMEWDGRKFEIFDCDSYDYDENQANEQLEKAKDYCLKNKLLGECYIDKGFEDGE